MHIETVNRQRILSAWALLAILILGDVWGLRATHMSLDATALRWEFVQAFCGAALFCASRLFWPGSRLTNLLHVGLIIRIYLPTTLILSYVAAACQQPLVDPYLIKSDELLGLDWLAFYNWTKSYSTFSGVLPVAYASFMPQMFLLQIVLNWRGKLERSWDLMWSSVISLTLCILFSGIWPAVGAFAHFHVSLDLPYLAEFKAIHDGTMKIIGVTPAQGIITFPSFHAAMAILYMYAARDMDDVFPFMIVLNGLMLLSVPISGGHYFVDEWSGILVALLSIFAVRVSERFVAQGQQLSF